MHAPLPTTERFASTLRRWPASYLLYILFSLVVILYAMAIDRTFLIDQQNYVDDFSEAATLDWLKSLFQSESLLQGLITQVFSEELLWRIWAAVLGSLFDPVSAVLLTASALNLLLVLSVRSLAAPALGVALWIVLPVGFAVTGLLQIRQGFAFAVLLFFALQLRRPVLGALIAAMIHTTFTVALVFSIVAYLFRSRRVLAVSTALLVAFAGAYLGGVLFDMFGGRRLAEYSVVEGATSINYVFGGLVCMLPSAYWFLRAETWGRQGEQARVLSNLAVVHIGSTAFALCSFFMFPLGASRVGYFTLLLLIPILPSLQLRNSRAAVALFSLLAVYLLYVTGKSYADGTYDIYFRP
jgi:hypothetical protein